MPWRCYRKTGLRGLTEQVLCEAEGVQCVSIPHLRSRAVAGLNGSSSEQAQAARTQRSLPLFSGPICLFSPAKSGHIKSQKLSWNIRASGIISLRHFPNKNLSLSSHGLFLTIPNKLKSLYLSQDIPSKYLCCTFVILP